MTTKCMTATADKPASEMTRREMIAAMAMQGILASLTKDDVDFSCSSVARSALCNADALLVELEKTK